jgi:hypothetical protein
VRPDPRQDASAKTIETRGYPLPADWVGVPIALLEPHGAFRTVQYCFERFRAAESQSELL